MKIAHLSQYFQPKLGYNDLYLPMKQQAMGHEVCMITSDRYMLSARFFRNVIRNRIVGTGRFYEEGILTYRLPCLFELEGVSLLMYGIKKALSIFKPDVVHCHDIISPTLIAAAFHKESFNYAFVADSITGTFHPEKIKKAAYLFYKHFVFPYAAKKVDKFFAITEGAREWLSEELGVVSQDIELIPLGADMELFKQDSVKRKEIRKSLGLSSDSVLIIYTGKIVPEKELATLVIAVDSLPCDLKSKVHMLLVGDGPKPYTQEISRLAHKHGLAGNIDFRPTVHRSKLPEFYSAADIGIWPGIPSNSIIEAMSTGLPVVITRYQPLRHEYQYDTSNLLEYHNGLSFTRGNTEELVACIEELTKDEKLRLSMGTRGRRLVEEKLNWNRISEMTLEVYGQILSCK